MSQTTNIWNEIFAREGRFFTEAHEAMPQVSKEIAPYGKVLDLGCGTGRHTVYLAKQGFSVYGLDNAPEGLAATRQWLADEGLSADLRLQSMMAKLPFANDYFDAIISVQVIHHAKIGIIRGIVAELQRVLKPGGFLFVTVPKLKNQGSQFEEIEPNTYIPLDGPEKGLAHHYFSRETLRELFTDFTVTGIELDSHAHYCLSATL